MEITSCLRSPKFLIFTVGGTCDRSVNGTYAGEIINHCRPETLSAFIQFPDQSFVLLQTANRCLFNTLGMIMTRLRKKEKKSCCRAQKKIPTTQHLCIHLSRFSILIYLICGCGRVNDRHYQSLQSHNMYNLITVHNNRKRAAIIFHISPTLQRVCAERKCWAKPLWCHRGQPAPLHRPLTPTYCKHLGGLAWCPKHNVLNAMSFCKR